MIYLYYTECFMGYDFGPEHPMQPARLMLTNRLIEEYGMLVDWHAERVEPYYASDRELLSVHTTGYLEALQAEEPNPAFGLSDQDNPVFPGMYDAARMIAGASIEAAKRVVQEDCSAFNFAGGLHHAMPDRASGFCLINDAALAILALRQRFSRVLYIDIDGHHGDGVQSIFYDDPSVLTLSIHQSGEHIFPGTGFVDELGSGDGLGYSVNIPLPSRSDDAFYQRAFSEIVAPVFRWFCPEAVVAQLGVDAHYADPLTSLNLTLSGYAGLVRCIRRLTDRYSEGRLLALGGGGYNMEVVPLAWSMAFQLLKGQEMPLDQPRWWVDFIRRSTGREPLNLPDVCARTDRDLAVRLAGVLDETLCQLKAGLSAVHGDIF
ncbi:MAG TPA: acetoin utilization protein AcuC [Methanotrichaceae archaeon]|nr:acetoin utilization protein AcuC [Methanotrichaceae archaeon]HQF17315.1 acetoin utilization protein AcuC [Methanotrichaceae archaeon]HQI91939.1 acetoin utilization protein AcuC [Methanotrichaceae archaeon]HQJ29264.1 acetoin utilization protein AcuC [Methanotrichaceae archaeon]